MSSFDTAMSMDTFITEEDNVRVARPRSSSANQTPAGGFFSNLFSCDVDTSCGVSKGGEIQGMYSTVDAVASGRSGETLGMSSNNDAVTSAVGSVHSAVGSVHSAVGSRSIVDEEDIDESNEKQDAQDDAIDSRSHVETCPSEASVDTEKQRTTDQRREVTPERNSARLSPEKSGGSDGAPSPPLDVNTPLANQSVTMANETTPLALIVQRVSQDPNKDGKVKRDQDSEGYELTAEDHFSGSM
jgi:hypothetical protein